VFGTHLMKENQLNFRVYDIIFGYLKSFTSQTILKKIINVGCVNFLLSIEIIFLLIPSTCVRLELWASLSSSLVQG